MSLFHDHGYHLMRCMACPGACVAEWLLSRAVSPLCSWCGAPRREAPDVEYAAYMLGGLSALLSIDSSSTAE